MLNRITLLSLVIILSLQLVCEAQNTVKNPDPLRFKDQINTFMEWDGKNSFQEEAVLFVGSSSIRLWKSHNAFPECPVINRGFGGAHISDVQFYYEKVIQKYAPSVIVFYAGDNDIAAGKSVEQVFNDYKTLTDRIFSDNPEVLFVYLPIKPSSSRWNHWEEMNEVNEMIRSYNDKNDQLFYVDLAQPLLKSNGKPNDSLFLGDQLHLNEQGYEAWNQVLGPELEELY